MGEKEYKAPNRPLTHKQHAFAVAFCGEALGNASAAARLAGYRGSDASLSQIGYENLRKLEVAAKIDELRKEADRLSKSRVMTGRQVLVGMSKIADGSIADVLNDRGEFDIVEVKRRGTDKLIKELVNDKTVRTWYDRHGRKHVVERTRLKVKLHDAKDARIYLGRHHRVWGDREQMDPDAELARILGMSKKEITAAFDAEGEVIDDDDEMVDTETAP